MLLTISAELPTKPSIRRYGKDKYLLVEGAGRLDSLTVQGDNVTVETLKVGYTSRPTGVARVGRTAWVSEGQLSYLFDPAMKDQPAVPNFFCDLAGGLLNTSRSCDHVE